MGKRFNVNGLCIPDKHYMVDISERLCRIKKMIDEGEYFTINRGRQYGKTTTLYALTRYLMDEYIVDLKIWHGEEYNRRGEEQLVEYLEAYHLDKGYMLSFCFNKKKDIGIREIQVKDKVLVEAVV